MDGPMPRHHAARVEAAIASGQAARSALVASWRRSSRLHHLDPAAAALPHAAERSRAAARRASASRRCSPPRKARMDRLYQAVGGVGCCVLLADGDGRAGRPPRRAGGRCDVQSWGLWTGALWSEEHEGTNGIGTCLVEQRPLTIDRDQHFFTRNTLLSCTAVPIYDHEAAFAGVLDVSSCRADRTDAFSNLIALAAGEAARRIEADLSAAPLPMPASLLTQARGRPVRRPRRGRRGRSRDRRDPVPRGVALGIAPGRRSAAVPAADLLGGDTASTTILPAAERAVLQRALLRAGGNVSARRQGPRRQPRHAAQEAQASLGFEISSTEQAARPDSCRRSATVPAVAHRSPPGLTGHHAPGRDRSWRKS